MISDSQESGYFNVASDILNFIEDIFFVLPPPTVEFNV